MTSALGQLILAGTERDEQEMMVTLLKKHKQHMMLLMPLRINKILFDLVQK